MTRSWLTIPIAAELPSPSDPWLTQPVATVIAACIAVVAAAIAYAGVTHAARNTRRETRRKEKLDVLIEGMAAARAYVSRASQLGTAQDQNVRDDLIAFLRDGEMHKLENYMTTAGSKLMLYGFDDVIEALQPFVKSVESAWLRAQQEPMAEVDIPDIYAKFSACSLAIRKSVQKLK